MGRDIFSINLLNNKVMSQKLTLLSKTLFLLCALVAGSGSAWAGNYSGTFTKCTGTLTSGTYVIGDVEDSKIHAINNTVGNSWIVYTDVNIGATGITNPDESVVWVYDSSTGYIKSVDGTNYIYWPTGGNKGGVGTTAYAHTITEQTTAGNYKVASSNDETRWIKRNGTSGYRYYNSGTPTLCFYKLSAPSYTITPSVNNSTMGSATVSGTTITASPNDGYRVSTSTPYTITEGAANVSNISQDGNTFTVTASGDCTVQINFEAIPTHTLSSAVSPVGAGTVTLGSATMAEGSTTTATAAANAGYKFTGWSITGTGTTLSSTSDNPTTVTIGTADATVTATFEAVTTYEINWSVNGEIQKTDNIEENTAITFPTSITGIPDGYVLKGWVVEANKISGTQNTAPTYVESANSTADITYYAVMAVGETSSATATLELKSTEGYSSSYSDQTFTDDKGNSWTGSVAVSTQDSKPCIQMKKSSGGSAITSPTFPGTVTAIKMLARNGSTKDARTFNFNSTASDNTGDLGTLEVAANHKYASELSATLTKEFSQFYLWVTDNLGFNKISVTYDVTDYSNFCTTIPTGTITLNAACNDGDVVYGTFYTDRAYIMPESLDGSVVSVDSEGKLVVDVAYEGSKGDVVPANTPLLINSYDTFTGTKDYTITYTSATGEDFSDYNMLKGTLTADETTTGDNCLFYRLTMHNGTDIGFWWGAANGAAFIPGSHKAYLTVSTNTSRQGFSLFGDDASGIGATLVNREERIVNVYDLQGRRVESSIFNSQSSILKKGLYIVNGKKIVIK